MSWNAILSCMKSSNFVFKCLFPLIAGFLSGCQGQNLVASQLSFAPTHIEVPKPSELTLRNPVLMVGLEPYLGQVTEKKLIPDELHLVSVGKPLLLKDSRGIIHRSKEITIIWRLMPLEKNQIIARQVVGPFASFESASRVAGKLRRFGLKPVIANPNDWQIWLSENEVLPEGVRAKQLKKKITTSVHPVLKGSSGELVLSGPISIDASDGLLWKGGVYKGPFKLQPDAYGTWTFVENVALDNYLQGVVPHEIGSGSPPVALAVQTVLARTWALANSHRFAIDGYHLCSDTQCQVYKDPREANKEIRKAILKTKGKVLSWKNKPIHAVYHATNGGVMAAGTEAWAMESVPYLRAQLDGNKKFTNLFLLPFQKDFEVKQFLEQVDGAYGSSHKRFRWKRLISIDELKEALNNAGIIIKAPQQIKILDRGLSGRVTSLQITDPKNQVSVVLKLDQIRRTLRNLPSTLFVVEPVREGLWEFIGGGFGHGAGLSQAGAIDLAFKGWSIEKILGHYYPGAVYGSLRDF